MPILRLDGFTFRPAHCMCVPTITSRIGRMKASAFAALAPLIDKARLWEVPFSLLLDNGDFVQGSPIGDVAADAFRAGSAGAQSDDRSDERKSATMPRRWAITSSTNGLDYLTHALAGAGIPCHQHEPLAICQTGLSPLRQ